MLSSICFNLDQSKILLNGLNSLPDNKLLDLSKFKAFADDNSNMYQKLKFTSERVQKD